jgi:hypothetical protein
MLLGAGSLYLGCSKSDIGVKAWGFSQGARALRGRPVAESGGPFLFLNCSVIRLLLLVFFRVPMVTRWLWDLAWWLAPLYH